VVEKRDDETGVMIPINWVFPDDLISRYANHILCQADADAATISFFEAHLPPVIGSEPEKRAFLESLGVVDAKCVARLIVSKSRLRDFAKVLQKLAEVHGTDARETDGGE